MGTGLRRAQDTAGPAVGPWERIYFLAVGLLAMWVGFWGYFVPSQVAKAIPFPVPPLHARFLGAIYLSGLVFMVAGMVVRGWADIRLIPLLTAIWTGGLLIVSLLHLEVFDFGRLQSRVWFGAYIAYPAIALWLTWRHRLLDADRYDSISTVPAWASRYLVGQGVLVTLLGAALLLSPNTMVDLWPWPITPLLAQIYSAPFLAYGVGSLLVARRATWIHVRVATMGFLVFSLGVLLASLIHRDLFSAGDAPDILWFVAFALGSLVLGILVARSLGGRARPT
jgi:hypothetical protein